MEKSKVEYHSKSYLTIKPHIAIEWQRVSRIDYWNSPTFLCQQPSSNRRLSTFSAKAKSKAISAMNWMMLFSEVKEVYSKATKSRFKFKLCFITLTLPSTQIHSDNYITTHLLQPFLKWCNRSHNVVNYIWKAEVQDNGNIHYHITANKFIHWKSIRTKWNQLCAAHGYCKIFQDGSNDKGDSATQIKAVKNEKMIVGYIARYITKKDTFQSNQSIIHKSDNHFYKSELSITITCEDGSFRRYKRIVHCKLWSCNHSLANLNCTISESDEDFYEAKSDLINFNSQLVVDKFTGSLKFPMKLNFITLHKLNITMQSIIHKSIDAQLCKAYEQFIHGDNNQNKYIVESLNQ